jgi:hypothetical protein
LSSSRQNPALAANACRWCGCEIQMGNKYKLNSKVKAMDNSLESVKLQLEISMGEYHELESRKANYRQIQSQLDSLSLAGLGVAISLILVVLDRSLQNIGVILLFPVVFYAVAFTQLRHERLLLISAIYVDTELRPQINKILSQLSKNDVHVLGHEKFMSNQTWAKSFLLEWFATASRAIVGLAIAIGIAVIYFYVRVTTLSVSAWNPYETWLLIVNALMLVSDLVIAFFIARTRYSHMSHYFKNQKKGT